MHTHTRLGMRRARRLHAPARTRSPPQCCCMPPTHARMPVAHPLHAPTHTYTHRRAALHAPACNPHTLAFPPLPPRLQAPRRGKAAVPRHSLHTAARQLCAGDCGRRPRGGRGHAATKAMRLAPSHRTPPLALVRRSVCGALGSDMCLATQLAPRTSPTGRRRPSMHPGARTKPPNTHKTEGRTEELAAGWGSAARCTVREGAEGADGACSVPGRVARRGEGRLWEMANLVRRDRP